jgi:two-component system alkaline phosphatase synthesis response regulator PhoP/two-component system response regulator VicR
MMSRVLIVDDEPSIVLPVKDEMSFEGFEVESAADGPSGLEKARQWRPDVLLLDLMLPGLNGFEICRQLRSLLPDLWIIVLTARGTEADRVTGFEAGADDYIVKPFSLRELVARVKVGLRRRNSPSSEPLRTFGNIVIDPRARRVTRGGVEVSLTRKEFDLLEFLAGHPGEVIPRDEFCNKLWGDDVYVTERVIDTHIASLRRKIETDPANPRHILSVRGVGYKLSSN